MDDVSQRARAAIAARDWDTLRPLLHPYLHWTSRDGQTVRGRTRVLAMLAQAAAGSAPDGPPRSVELRDGQIYRWSA